jgi:hypothetical protein
MLFLNIERQMFRKIRFILILLILAPFTKAQTGGDNTYEFLNLTHSGLIASLGGTNVSLYTDNLNSAYHNPGLLNSSMDKSLALNYVNYFAGINYGSVMYSMKSSQAGSFAAGLTYLNYGSFTEADPSGVITGKFTASEYAFSLTFSRSIDSLITAGVTFKPVLSFLEKYNSIGFAFDFGASYHNRSGLFSAGLVIKNAGLQLTRYAGEERLPLPFEIQAGASQKLAHAPFRFSLTLRHLEKFDLTHLYRDTSSVGTNVIHSSDFLENLMRHIIVGTELIPHKNFYLSAGFNYQRRRELQVDSNLSTVGFSWGFGINTSVLSIEFGRASYHLAGASNHVSFIIRPDLIFSRFRK